MPVLVVEPAVISLTVWTVYLLGFPIDLKMAGIKALVGLRLPTVIQIDRTDQIDVLCLAIDEVGAGDIGRICNVFTRQDLVLLKVRMKSAYNRAIRLSGRCRFNVGNQVGCISLTRRRVAGEHCCSQAPSELLVIVSP